MQTSSTPLSASSPIDTALRTAPILQESQQRHRTAQEEPLNTDSAREVLQALFHTTSRSHEAAEARLHSFADDGQNMFHRLIETYQRTASQQLDTLVLAMTASLDVIERFTTLLSADLGINDNKLASPDELCTATSIIDRDGFASVGDRGTATGQKEELPGTHGSPSGVASHMTAPQHGQHHEIQTPTYRSRMDDHFTIHSFESDRSRARDSTVLLPGQLNPQGPQCFQKDTRPPPEPSSKEPQPLTRRPGSHHGEGSGDF